MEKLKAIGIISFLWLCLAVPITVKAETVDTPADNPIILQYVNMSNAISNLSITNGNAKIVTSVYGTSSVTRVEMTVEIQEKFGFIWITKQTWNSSENGSSMRMERNYPVISGKTYRAKVKVTVYTASGSETAIVTSSVLKAD